MTASVLTPGDAHVVGIVRDTWQRPGVGNDAIRAARGQLWERLREAEHVARQRDAIVGVRETPAPTRRSRTIARFRAFALGYGVGFVVSVIVLLLP